jgi:flagellar motor switch/type III secretory pathway protein FliN
VEAELGHANPATQVKKAKSRQILRSVAIPANIENEFPPILFIWFWSRYCLLPLYMTATLPLAPPASEQANGSRTAVASGVGPGAALVSPSHPPEWEGIALSAPLRRLPVELDVSVPVRSFRVRNLLALEPSQLIDSGWGPGEDVPLAAGKVQLAWSEFEVVDTHLAVRLTRLV